MSVNQNPEEPSMRSMEENSTMQDPKSDSNVSRDDHYFRALVQDEGSWVELTSQDEHDQVVPIADFTAFSEHYRISVIEGFEPAAYCEYDHGTLSISTAPLSNGEPDRNSESWHLDTSMYSNDREFQKELERYVTLIGFAALGYRTPRVDGLLEAAKSERRLPREAEYRAILRAYVEWALESQEDWQHLATDTEKEFQDTNSLTEHMFSYVYREVGKLTAPFLVIREREIFPWNDRVMVQIRSLDVQLDKLHKNSLWDRYQSEGQNAKIVEMLGFISSVRQKLEFFRIEFASDPQDEGCASTSTHEAEGLVSGLSRSTSVGQDSVSAERSVSLNDDCFCVLMALFKINQPQKREAILSMCLNLGFEGCTADVVTRYCSTKYLKKQEFAEMRGSGWVITEKGRLFATYDHRYSEDYRYPGHGPGISSPVERPTPS